MHKFATCREADQFRAGVVNTLAGLLKGYAQPDADGTPNAIYLGDEAKLWVSYDSHKHRFNISGCWPSSKIDRQSFSPSQLWNPQVESPSISVSADKSAQQIAADITRRFLPAYHGVLKRLQEQRDHHDAFITGSNSLASELATILRSKARGNYGQNGPEQRFVNIISSKFSGDIEVSGESTSFKLRSLSADRARKLATFLATL